MPERSNSPEEDAPGGAGPARASLDTAYAQCMDLIRRHDRDRFLAILFSPAQARRHLAALYAFNLEVARVREVVREPLPGEVRLQWWRELIEGLGRGDVSGHPVAAALLHSIDACALPRGALLNLIEARSFDLYDDPMPTLNDLEGYAGETSSVLVQLASGILLGRSEPRLADAAGHAGVAIALTGLMRALPILAARGQCYLPLDILARHGSSRDDVVERKPTAGLLAALAALRASAEGHLDAARRALAGVPAEAMPAFLTLALVPADLRALAEVKDPFQTVAGSHPLMRQWTLWRAARRVTAGKPLLKAPR